MSDKYNPQWVPGAKFTGRGGYNMDQLRAAVDSLAEQVLGLTQVVNTYEQRHHEAETRLSAVEQTERVLENTSPSEKKPGKKAAAGKEGA